MTVGVVGGKIASWHFIKLNVIIAIMNVTYSVFPFWASHSLCGRLSDRNGFPGGGREGDLFWKRDHLFLARCRWAEVGEGRGVGQNKWLKTFVGKMYDRNMT